MPLASSLDPDPPYCTCEHRSAAALLELMPDHIAPLRSAHHEFGFGVGAKVPTESGEHAFVSVECAARLITNVRKGLSRAINKVKSGLATLKGQSHRLLLDYISYRATSASVA